VFLATNHHPPFHSPKLDMEEDYWKQDVNICAIQRMQVDTIGTRLAVIARKTNQKA